MPRAAPQRDGIESNRLRMMEMMKNDSIVWLIRLHPCMKERENEVGEEGGEEGGRVVL